MFPNQFNNWDNNMMMNNNMMNNNMMNNNNIATNFNNWNNNSMNQFNLSNISPMTFQLMLNFMQMMYPNINVNSQNNMNNMMQIL